MSLPLVNGATLVAKNNRAEFLAKELDSQMQTILENMLNKKAKGLLSSYHDEQWEVVAIDGELGFFYPTNNKVFSVMNIWADSFEVDNVTFGIICSLYAYNELNHMLFAVAQNEQSDLMNKLYFRLRDWVWCDETRNELINLMGDDADNTFTAIYRMTD